MRDGAASPRGRRRRGRRADDHRDRAAVLPARCSAGAHSHRRRAAGQHVRPDLRRRHRPRGAGPPALGRPDGQHRAPRRVRRGHRRDRPSRRRRSATPGRGHPRHRFHGRRHRGPDGAPSTTTSRHRLNDATPGGQVTTTSGAEMHPATLWEAMADRLGDAPAIIQGSTTTTWREFDQRASRLAGTLQAAGFGVADKVAVYLYNGPEFLEAFFAAFKLRGQPVNVNYRYLDAELAYLLDNSDARALIFHSSLAERVSFDRLLRAGPAGAGARRCDRAGPWREHLGGGDEDSPGRSMRTRRAGPPHALHGRHHRYAEGGHLRARRAHPGAGLLGRAVCRGGRSVDGRGGRRGRGRRRRSRFGPGDPCPSAADARNGHGPRHAHARHGRIGRPPRRPAVHAGSRAAIDREAPGQRDQSRRRRLWSTVGGGPRRRGRRRATGRPVDGALDHVEWSDAGVRDEGVPPATCPGGDDHRHAGRLRGADGQFRVACRFQRLDRQLRPSGGYPGPRRRRPRRRPGLRRGRPGRGRGDEPDRVLQGPREDGGDLPGTGRRALHLPGGLGPG